jgi:flavin-dependent dehydrogenase
VVADRVEVAVVGGGLAGAAIASMLADAGRDVLVLERQPSWHWRACGVFASPAAVAELRRLGLDELTLAQASQPIPAMRVESQSGTAFRLTYGDDGSGHASAVGFDRSVLDPALMHLASTRGAGVRCGATIASLELNRDSRRDWHRLRTTEGAVTEARIVVGADGIHSMVSRSAGVARGTKLPPRIGLTYHIGGDDRTGPDARMVVFGGGYCGIAPVPGGRVNVGIVLGGGRWRSTLAGQGAKATARTILGGLPPDPVAREPWRTGPECEDVAGAWPLGYSVRRRTGDGWLLVGDAAGFLDPFTGEGIHRALVSARLAARAVLASLARREDGLVAYERVMRARFVAKDVVSHLVQLFLAWPALFEYAARRLASRRTPRETLGLVMGDLVPASRALDPGFLVELLAP